MTINKRQTQLFSYVGLFLPKSIFIYGQFYVVVLRVKFKSDLKILILEENVNPYNTIKNVVFFFIKQKMLFVQRCFRRFNIQV